MWGNLGGANFLNHSFGNNSDIYLQFRYRITPSMISNLNTWSSNWKIYNFYQGTVPCQAMEITGVHPIYNQTTYTNCGDSLATLTTSADATSAASPPYLSQQDWALPSGTTHEAHGVISQYPNVNWDLPTNSWMTFYVHIHIATLGGSGNGSTVEVWVQTYGTNYWYKITSWRGNLQYTNSSSDVYDALMFTNYMTANTGGAVQATSTWTTEVIVSTQPISMPQTFPATP